MPTTPTQLPDIGAFLEAVIPDAKTVYVFGRSDPDEGAWVPREDVADQAAKYEDPRIGLDTKAGWVQSVAVKAQGDSPVSCVSVRMTGSDSTVFCVYYLHDAIHLDDLPEDVFIDELPLPSARWKAEIVDEDSLYRIDGERIVLVADTPSADVEQSADEEDAEEAGSGPVTVHQATLIGTACTEFEALMAQEATFLTGDQWLDKPYKSTQAGKWEAVSLTWQRHTLGFDKTKNSPEYGLSRHPVGKTKDGFSFVFGSSIGGQRKAKAMDTMYAIGLDIDSGAAFETVRDRLLKMGVAAFMYTSWNHRKRGLTLKRDDVLKKLEIDSDPTLDQVRDYLRNHGKNRFEEDFINSVEIAEQKVQEQDGVKIILDTPEIHKFRVIIPLAEPVKIIDLAERHDDALAIWEDKITGLAQKHLQVHFDTSCTDPSRLFYTPRHAKGSEVHESLILQGKPISFDEIKTMRKALYTRNRDLNPFVEADDQIGEKVSQVTLPSGDSLNKWHTKYGKSRFQIADMLEAERPDKIRVSGGEASGSVHLECPFEHLHSKEGGTATMATNALDSPSGYWTVHCKHDACQDRHKLEFLGEMIKEGWIEETVLFSDEYLLPDEEEEVEDDPTEYTQPENPELPPEPKDPLTLAQKITTESSEEDVKKFFKRLIRRDVDDVVRENVIADIAKRTNLGKRQLTKWWREIIKAKKAKEDLSADDRSVMDVTSDLPDLVNHARAGIYAANEEEARLFHFVDAPAYTRRNATGITQIEAVTSKDKMKVQINKVAKFSKSRDQEGNIQIVSVPDDAANMVLHDDLTFMPPLKAVTSSPFFSADGSLVAADGYHRASATLLCLPDGFAMPDVPTEPTEGDVTEAKRLLVEEAFGDFPVSGVSRATLVSEALGEESMTEEAAAGLAHLIAVTLLPFCRNMIDGPTPGHLINKPAPGTGASLLVDTMSIIATGVPTPTKTLPSNKAEVGKTLTAVLVAGNPIVFFDNIDREMDTGELASAMTAPTFSARILGVSAMVETEVRCVWVFTGNKVTMSHELVRRNILIPLNAGLEPTKRTAWRHKDLRGWVRQNRGRLVWACLTLIQNWIAKGKRPSDKELASYDRWSATMGGILRDAGLRGFLANEELLHGTAKREQEEGVCDLLDLIANLPDGAILRPGGWTKPRDASSDVPVVSIMHLLNRDPDDNSKLPPELHAKQHDDRVIIIPRWGCHLVEEVYKTANKLTAEWRALADRPQQGYDEKAQAMVPLRFEEKRDERMKPYWVLRKGEQPGDGAQGVDSETMDQAKGTAADE